MGVAEETVESDSAPKKWVIAGIQFMAPLKPIYTKTKVGKTHEDDEEEEEKDEAKEFCTTPTSPESMISCSLKCPGAPRKRKAVSRSHCNDVRDYFKSPELESFFQAYSLSTSVNSN